MESISSARWISEWEMEETAFIDEIQIDPFEFSFDEFKFEQSDGAGTVTATAAEIYDYGPSAVVEERPAKQLKVAAADGAHCQIFAPTPKADSSSSSSHIICFQSSNSKSSTVVEPKLEMDFESDRNLNFSSLISESSWKENNRYCWSRNGQGTKRAASGSMNRNPLHAREHVIAERKRREKLSQRFIALSALIPGLNKIDKASILGGAVRYVKELQERLKEAEERASKISEEAATVYVKRSSLSCSDDDVSSSEENTDSSGGPVPEIEARVSNKDVLLRIHTHKRKGCLSYLHNKIENLNLTILNSTALPFAHSQLHITIVAQMDIGFCMSMEDVVKNLRQALLEFI
ncbi:transcription factor bHLH19-like [Momordica charantia]|uniref:Transcription factor bHLH19-like n=1 Tax=Momordica charantia TaxID=3673 RepID=A0A6J1BY31_MOMCH|nr:transcription factor bHLH19-like [Momordica charantia]